jgi:hypothetical protein
MQSPSPSAAPSPHLPVRPDWLDRRREEIIEPDLPIVDPHHHLVERPETGRYLLPELLADASDGHNITATVYLEWLSMYRAQGPVELRPVGEVEFANGVAAMAASGTYGRTQICAGIVGYADLTLGAPVEKVLQAMIQAGGGRFRGIRFITASHPEQAAWGSAVIRPEGLWAPERIGAFSWAIDRVEMPAGIVGRGRWRREMARSATVGLFHRIGGPRNAPAALFLASWHPTVRRVTPSSAVNIVRPSSAVR